MAGSSNLDYLYASNANVSNFVSVKLSGNHNYPLWKRQMLCLMETHDMRGIVDAASAFDGPRTSSIMKKYDSLLTGWIFGSISEDVLAKVLDLYSAKDVWEKLNSTYDNPTISFQQDSAQTKPEAKEETNDKDVVSAETETKDKDAVSAEAETTKDKDAVSAETETETKGEIKDEDVVSAETETKGKDVVSEATETATKVGISTETENKEEIKDRRERTKKWLKAATDPWDLWEVKDILEKYKHAWREELNSEGNTVLHLAVGLGYTYSVSCILDILEEEEVLEIKNKNGSTALHLAAIVGNKRAAELLVDRNKNLMTIQDNQGEEPLHKAYSNMQFDTFMYLYGAATRDGKTISLERHTQNGIDLLVNAISAKKYRTALKLFEEFPEFAVESDDALMVIARTFPTGLTKAEKLIYPTLGDMRERIIARTRSLFMPLEDLLFVCRTIDIDDIESIILILLFVPMTMLVLVYQLIRFLILMVYLPFFLLYFPSWKVASILAFAPIKHIEEKKNEREIAKKLLNLVCDKIDQAELKSGTHHFNYNRSILEAACHNASRVVDEILSKSPEAITSTNESGHDIIQLAVIHRSEKVYNLIYEIEERRSLYKTLKDCSGNNILHLASRLAPSHKLNRRTGAALQLQRELQWREEVKKLVFPTCITKENIFKETPDMVFTREHENLVKEGEKWMKTTAESCSITAALITTIVFAAAITVPGGSNQETGIPLFTKDIAFTIFAISDAISLFTSSTSLLAFLSILTARFAEEDFLVSLPRRLLIGLCSLLLSATAMMVAFSATLFLVFCHKKPWMFAPICGLACLPIAFFFIVQLPLIVDLFRSSYGRTFGMKSNSDPGRFINRNSVRGFFGK